MQGMRQKATDSMRLFTTSAADALQIWETNHQPCRPVCVQNVLLMGKISRTCSALGVAVHRLDGCNRQRPPAGAASPQSGAQRAHLCRCRGVDF